MTLVERALERISYHSTNGLSTLAPRVDHAINVAILVGAVLSLSLLVALVLALLRRRVSHSASPSSAPSSGFFVIFGTVMLAIAGGLFWVGYVPYLDAAVAPADAYEIQATSQKGSWSFSYPSGKVSVNRLVVPRWRPVRLVMSSKDRIHDLYLPQFRLQQLAIPGRYTSLWFQATETKTIPIECTQACPSGYAGVPAVVSIVEPDQFDRWLALNDKPKQHPPSLKAAP